jgi:uncharacterized membrane protein
MPLATAGWMLALLLSALASGVAFSHILEIRGKRRMGPDQAIEVQQVLYVGYRLPAAVIEVGATVIALAAALLVWGKGAEFWLGAAASAALLGSLVVFAAVTDRQNRRILAWRPDDPPSDWARVRATWESSHGVRAALFLAAVGLLAAAIRAA